MCKYLGSHTFLPTNVDCLYYERSSYVCSVLFQLLLGVLLYLKQALSSFTDATKTQSRLSDILLDQRYVIYNLIYHGFSQCLY